MKINYDESALQEREMTEEQIEQGMEGAPPQTPPENAQQSQAPQMTIGAFGPIISHTFEGGQMQPTQHPELAQFVNLLNSKFKEENGFFSLDETNGMVMYKDGSRVEIVSNIQTVPAGTKITNLAKEMQPKQA